MNIRTEIQYACSNQARAAFVKLKNWDKVKVIAATILGAIFFIVPGIAAFGALTHKYSKNGPSSNSIKNVIAANLPAANEKASAIFGHFISSEGQVAFNHLIELSTFDKAIIDNCISQHGLPIDYYEKRMAELKQNLVYDRYEGFIEKEDKDQIEENFPELAFTWQKNSDSSLVEHEMGAIYLKYSSVMNLEAIMESLIQSFNSAKTLDRKLTFFLSLKDLELEYPQVELPSDEFLDDLKQGQVLKIYSKHTKIFEELMKEKQIQVKLVGFDESIDARVYKITGTV